MKRYLLASLCMVFAYTHASAKGLIPVEELFKATDVKSFKLSPDGKYLAALAQGRGSLRC